MVGNAHIDPMWIWDWDEGMHEVLQTFRAAADRLDEDSELRFTASSASYYRWVLDTSPELFARIRRHVDAGRWVVTGGQWVEPDCNLPAGESVCRQFLYGQRFLADHLGITASVGYNIDSFGHSGTLPQLLAASGIGAYVFMRPGPEEKEISSPAFLWRGTDGTELPAYRIPYEYSTEGAEEELIRARAGELVARSSALGLPLMAFFGVGDHGGGPTRLAMRTVHALSAESGGTVAFGDPATYFEELGDGVRGELPVVEGELQWHAVGCYSARADLKLANAKAEDALVAAEVLNEMSRLLTGDAPDVRRELADAWEGVLFAQFHDALGGTCTDRATAAVHALLVSGASRAERVAVRALHRVAEHVDTWVEGAEMAEGLEASAIGGLPVPLLAFNPHSWPVTGPVSIPHPIAVATDAQGRRVPVQQIPSGEVTYSPTRSLLQVTVPPLGYRRYWLHATDPDAGTPQAGVAPAHAGADGALGNGLLALRVDTTTGALAEAVATRQRAAGGDAPVGRRGAADRRRRRERHLVPRCRPLRGRRGRRAAAFRRARGGRPGPRHRAERLVVRRAGDDRDPGRLRVRRPASGRGGARRRVARGVPRPEAGRAGGVGRSGEHRRGRLRISGTPLLGSRGAHGPLGRSLGPRCRLGPRLHLRVRGRLRRARGPPSASPSCAAPGWPITGGAGAPTIPPATR